MSPAPTPKCDWARTPHKPATVQWSRRDHRCPARPMLRHRRCQRAPTSLSAPAQRRCHEAATLLIMGAEYPTPVTTASVSSSAILIAWEARKQEGPPPDIVKGGPVAASGKP